MGSSFDLSWTKRQHWLRSVEFLDLDLGLLVHGKNQGVLGRVHIKADHIADLLGEPTISTDLESPRAVRLSRQPRPKSGPPAASSRHRLRRQALAPMRATHWDFLDRLGQGSRSPSPRLGRAFAVSRTVRFLEPFKAFLIEASNPLIDVAGGDSEGGGDLRCRTAFACSEDDACTCCRSAIDGARACPSLQRQKVFSEQVDLPRRTSHAAFIGGMPFSDPFFWSGTLD